MSNTAHIVETALLLLVAYLLGCILGYGIRRILYAARGTRQVAAVAQATVVVAPAPSSEPRPTRSHAARLAATVDEPLPPPKRVETAPVPPGPAPEPAVAKRPAKSTKSGDAKPPALDTARDGKADNLKQIKGIGPKIEASLYAMGVFHIDQIASWTKANAEWVEGQLAFKGRIRRERWVEQAIELTKARADA
jgi:NADH-quinone oxidoreductase subunit E